MPFSPNNVTIIGQAFTLIEVVPVTVLVCNCEAKKTISVPGLNVQAQCSACKRLYSVHMVECKVDHATGKKAFNASIAMATPRTETSNSGVAGS